jgi:U3 small nucleolar RNA-associated protein 12
LGDCVLQFENIQKLEGHHGEVWALALSHHGNFVVTGSHDKSIRIWEKLEEPVSIAPEDLRLFSKL